MKSTVKTVKAVKFQDFIQVANFFYMSIGIQPYSRGGSSSLLVDVVFYATLINLTMHVVLLILAPTMLNLPFMETAMVLSYICFACIGEIKMVIVWRKKRVLTALMDDMTAIFPQTAAEQECFKVRRYLRVNKAVFVMFSVLYMVLIWFYNLFALLQYLVHERLLGVRVIGQTLSYAMYTPWQWQGTWVYYLTYFLQNLAGYACAAGQISSDLLLCALAAQAIMHYDYIARTIEQYTAETALGERDLKFLGGIIAHHDKILQFSGSLNEIFGIPLLFNFMVSSFGICFVSFQIAIGVEMDVLIKLCLYMVSSMAQVYIICHYGQQLIDASLNVSHACYRHNWPDADVRYQKMLVLVTQRAQKPAQLMATSFVHISRGTMTDIMQLSYKFFALLRTMYAD